MNSSVGISAKDLRALVTRVSGIKKKVAVLASDEALVALLKNNGHELLVNPELDALAAFAPELVLGFDGFLSDENALTVLSSVAPAAKILLCFSNGASSTQLLHALTDQRAPQGFLKSKIEARLLRAGYITISDESVVMPREPLNLSADTEAKLRQLFEQLNPLAAVERFVILAQKGSKVSSPDVTQDLISVVVSDSHDEGALQATLACLGNQLVKPLQVIVVSSREISELILKPLRGRAHIELRVLRGTATHNSSLWNAGFKESTGQYVVFLDAGTLLDSNHLSSLKLALANSTRAWAVAGDDLPFDELAKSKCTTSAHWIFDVTRLGQFALSFAEVPAAQLMLFARMLSLFEPVFVPNLLIDAPAQIQDVNDLFEVLKARPLQELQSLAARFASPSTTEVVLRAVDKRVPQLTPLVNRTLRLAKRVEQAWVSAKISASKEMKNEPE